MTGDIREDYLAILVYAVIILGIGLTILFISFMLGPKRRSGQKYEPYECGAELLDDTRKKFNIKFYLVATLFILFDIETVFLLPWAVEFKTMGIVGIIDMFVFMAILVVGLFYLIKRGAIEWD